MSSPLPPPSLPGAQLPPLADLRLRCALQAEVRAFFVARGFVEVDTPVVITAPAAEAAIDAVPVTLRGRDPKRPHRRYLQTSPELAMKRLVAAGLAPIFQIAPVFRDGDEGPLHCPEFRMLEWYRAPAPYTEAMDDCEALVRHLAGRVAELVPQLTPAHAKRLEALQRPFVRLRVDEAVRRHTGLELAELTTREALAHALRERYVHHADSDTWADLFHRVFVGVVEPALLAAPTPFFLTHFPAPLASLAQLDADDPRVAERFELYGGGMELANGFGELRCGAEQRRRFAEEGALRRSAGKAVYPLDEAYLEALASLPPTAGVAVGLERLVAVVLDKVHLDAVALVPWRNS